MKVPASTPQLPRPLSCLDPWAAPDTVASCHAAISDSITVGDSVHDIGSPDRGSGGLTMSGDWETSIRWIHGRAGKDMQSFRRGTIISLKDRCDSQCELSGEPERCREPRTAKREPRFANGDSRIRNRASRLATLDPRPIAEPELVSARLVGERTSWQWERGLPLLPMASPRVARGRSPVADRRSPAGGHRPRPTGQAPPARATGQAPPAKGHRPSATGQGSPAKRQRPPLASPERGGILLSKAGKACIPWVPFAFPLDRLPDCLASAVPSF
jgi:hypothetical protein